MSWRAKDYRLIHIGLFHWSSLSEFEVGLSSEGPKSREVNVFCIQLSTYSHSFFIEICFWRSVRSHKVYRQVVRASFLSLLSRQS